MTAYCWKSESEDSEALKLAEKEIKKQNLNVRDAKKQNCIFLCKYASIVRTGSGI